MHQKWFVVMAVGLLAARDASADSVCGGLASPTKSATPTSSSAGPAAIVELPDGRFVISVTGYGMFAIPFKSVSASSDHTGIATAWAFGLTGDKLVTLGELDHVVTSGGGHSATRFASGRGTPAFAKGAGGFAACGATASKPLPALPASRRLLDLSVEGSTLFALTDEAGRKATGCKRLTSGSAGSRKVYVDALDLTAAKPRWIRWSTREVTVTPGKGCRGVALTGFDVNADGAAVLVQSCTHIDGGDYMSMQNCTARVDALLGKKWQSITLPGAFDPSWQAKVSVRGGAVRLATSPGGDRGKVHVSVAKGATFVAEGDDVDGQPLVLDGTRMIIARVGGIVLGETGVGWRVQARELTNGAWKETTPLFDVDAVRDAAFAWAKDRLVAVFPEDQGPRNPLTARVVEAKNGTWRDLAMASVVVTP